MYVTKKMKLVVTVTAHFKGKTTLSITTFRIRGFYVTLSITILCYYAECHILFTIMLYVIMLSVIMPSVVILSVVVPISADVFQK